jgi:hypothetical protein
MATTRMELRADKDKLDAEITAITTAINDKEAAHLEAIEALKPERYLVAIEKSLDALRTDKTTLNTQRKELQHDIANQSNQGKLQYCQHIVMSLLRRHSQTQTSSLCQSVC